MLTINTASAVVAALQTTENIYVNFVLAAIAAAAGATEIATISSAKYAEGTEFLDDAKAPQGTDTINIWADRGERIVPKGINSKIPRDVKNEDIPMLINYALMSKGLGGYGTLTIDNNKVDFSKAEYYLQGIYTEAKNKQAFDNNGRLKVKISNGNLITIFLKSQKIVIDEFLNTICR